jgi:hypothetical protein
MPAAKPKYTAIRVFDRTDPKTGKDTHYNIGDPYDGPDPDKYLEWHDGALIALNDSPAASAAAEATAPDDDSSSDGSAKK